MEENSILLALAAEDFSDQDFENYHTFTEYEDRIILKLIAHGPVLLRGGRGIGKSTLFKEAYYRINRTLSIKEKVMGIYVSCRSLPLLRSTGLEYERILCEFLINHVNKYLINIGKNEWLLSSSEDVAEVQKQLSELADNAKKRIVLFFDDVAHIGREASLKEFFDVFRTLSSNQISCKATIYPGVTAFGDRFDLLNDAVVIDIARTEIASSFAVFFTEIMKKRYSTLVSSVEFSRVLQLEDVAAFLGRAVMGNVRAFIYACNYLFERFGKEGITIPNLDETMKFLNNDYYWPLFEELQPKLGPYELLVEPSKEVADILFKFVAESLTKTDYGASCLIHREHIERLKKVFEILEYIGFISKRETSRALKSGGRGPRYAINICILMEHISPYRLTIDLYNRLLMTEKEFSQIFKNGETANELLKIKMPEKISDKEMGILEMPIERLEKSKVYPYGLTSYRLSILKESGINTIGELVSVDREKISGLHDIGSYWMGRIENIVAQAIWM